MSYILSIRSMSAFSEYKIATGGDDDDDDDDDKNNVTYGDSVLDPSIWSDLPTAMVELIFAQLPLREVYRLRSLSRGWRSAIASPDSEFMRLVMMRKSSNKLVYNSEAFNAGHSKIIKSPVAIWSGIVDANHFTFRVIDHDHDDQIGASKFHESWCALTFTPPVEYLFSWFAHDGGLVCLFPDNHIRCWTLADNASDDDNEKHANYEERLRDSTPLPLLVANPLTNVQKTLPFQNVVHKYPDMVQLRVDRDSGEYKVILVGQGIDCGYAAEIYDSSTGKWSTLIVGYVFDYMFEQYLCDETRSAQIYDCGRGECQKPQYSSPPNGALLACTQFKGSYYELRRETMRNLQEVEDTLESTENSKEEFTYTISQFQCDDSYRFHLKGKVEVVDEEIPLDECYHPSLLACNSFILLLADICPRYNVDDQEAPPRVMRLYNMALGNWVPIPQGRFEVETHNRTHTQDHMIELQWAVVP